MEEQAYDLSLEDIIMHFGFELSDSYENYSSRGSFYQNIGLSIFQAMLVGYVSDFEVISPKQLDKNKFEISSRGCTPVITPEMIAKAKFFANDLLKQIPEEIFTNRNMAIIEKEKELDDNFERIKNLKACNINCSRIKTIAKHPESLKENTNCE